MLAALTAAGARRNTGFAWGRMNDGAVVLIDPSPVEPEGPARGGRPGRVTFVPRVDAAPLVQPASPTEPWSVG
jgi:hypothetical protein